MSQTGVPPPVLRSSGSRVRLPVITTTLTLLAATWIYLSDCLIVPKSKTGIGVFSPPRRRKRRKLRDYAGSASSSAAEGVSSAATGSASAAAEGSGSAAAVSSAGAGPGVASAAGGAGAGASAAASLLRRRGASGLRGARGRGARGRGGGAVLVVVAPAAAATARATGRGAGKRGGRRRLDDRRVGVDLEDPEAQHAVGDLQVVVELVEQRALGLEAKEAVVGLVAPRDLVGQLAQAPGLLGLEAAAGLDAPPGLGGDLVAALVRSLRIEHQHQFVLRRAHQHGQARAPRESQDPQGSRERGVRLARGRPRMPPDAGSQPASVHT